MHWYSIKIKLPSPYLLKTVDFELKDDTDRPLYAVLGQNASDHNESYAPRAFAGLTTVQLCVNRRSSKLNMGTCGYR